MDKPLITICTVNYNTAEFIELMLFAFEKLTAQSYKVIIRDNNSTEKDYLKLKSIVERYSNVTLYRVATATTGSLAHGEALNDLVQKIDTPHGVIMDADATFLLKGWDMLLLNSMSEKMPIYGTQADSVGDKPMDFPLMFALIFSTEILKSLHIDFRPNDIKKLQDTGWQLREKYLNANLTGGLLYDFNTRIYKNGPFSEVVCSEYYLSSADKAHIIAAHFGRGSAPQAKNLVKVRAGRNLFLKLINKCLWYANVSKWKRDKKKWLTICRRIIDAQ